MSYFDDVLRTANGHLDQDLWVPAPTKFKLLEINASCKPKTNVNLSHSYQRTSEWKTGKDKKVTEDIANKTVTKWAFSVNDRKYGVDLTSDTLKATVAGNVMKGDMKIDAKAEFENKYLKNAMKGKAMFNIASPVMMDKLRTFANLDVEMNSANESTITFKNNANWEKFSVGIAFENKAGEWTKQYAQFVNNFNSKSCYWARANMHEETFGLGCKVDHGSFTHSYELETAFGKDNTCGVMNSPISLVMGGDYKLNDKTNVDYTMRIASDISYNQNVEHELSEKCSLTVGQSFDSANIEGKEPAYKLGFGLNYKL